MTEPIVSVIIPSYNAEKTLGRALESLRQQSYRPLEVLLMDGGSKDGTVTVARQYQDIITTLVSEKDRGQAHAINKGFDVARGDYVCWLCADDTLLPETMRHVVNHFALDPELDLISGACERKYEDGSVQVVVPPANAFQIIGAQYRIEQPSTFWRRKAQGADLRLEESFHYAFDWDFFARLAKRSRKSLLLPDVMSSYYFSPTNKTSTGGRNLVNEMYQVVERHGPLDGRLAKVFSLLYRRFDLAGCFDTPPTCTSSQLHRFARIHGRLEERYGKELIHLYNWNFASKQERGLIWYK